MRARLDIRTERLAHMKRPVRAGAARSSKCSPSLAGLTTWLYLFTTKAREAKRRERRAEPSNFIQLVVRSFASFTYIGEHRGALGASKMLRATGHARMVTSNSPTVLLTKPGDPCRLITY